VIIDFWFPWDHWFCAFDGWVIPGDGAAENVITNEKKHNCDVAENDNPIFQEL
jgi:hypothetical protein